MQAVFIIVQVKCQRVFLLSLVAGIKTTLVLNYNSFAIAITPQLLIISWLMGNGAHDAVGSYCLLGTDLLGERSSQA